MIHWGILLQQGLLLALSGLFALLVILGLSARGVLREHPGWRLILEFGLIGGLLLLLGLGCEPLLYGAFLPGRVEGWHVAGGLLFYWLVLIWPLRVFWLRKELVEASFGGLVQFLGLMLVLTAGYACFVEPRLLDAEEPNLVFEEIKSEPIRVAHISDLQVVGFGAREADLIATVNEFGPDLIILTGDYVGTDLDDEPAIEAARQVLGELEAKLAVFATSGDSDSPRQREEVFKGLDVHYLRNHVQVLEHRGVSLRVACLDHQAPDWAELERGSSTEELFILAGHRPELAEEAAEKLPNADLYLSGYTHGGQLQLPFLGPILARGELSREVTAGGIFAASNGMPFAVSRGVGFEGDYAPRMRLNCRPHVFLFTLSGS
ncbi:MAG: metallophosphoesterase [Planctomycetota bacterium]|jgi:predicted MPP superfamily phosphohydrolase